MMPLLCPSFKKRATIGRAKLKKKLHGNKNILLKHSQVSTIRHFLLKKTCKFAKLTSLLRSAGSQNTRTPVTYACTRHPSQA